MKADSKLMQTVNEINPDFTVKLDKSTSKQTSNSKLNIFFAEIGRLKRIVAGFGLSSSDGEDVLQDVSIKALERSGENKTYQEHIRWLTKVTVNRCLTEHRRRRSFHRHARKILLRQAKNNTDSKRVDDKMIFAEELEIVRQSLQKLNDSLLGPVILRYFCDFNSKEVGDILGLKATTVRSRLREARMILAKQLIEQGIEP
jgi:RNA polymerase sigma-70 factor (ECF subfamily)